MVLWLNYEVNFSILGTSENGLIIGAFRTHFSDIMCLEYNRDTLLYNQDTCYNQDTL